TGMSADIDLRFTISARQFPSSYSQWAMSIPPGLPNGFGQAVAPGGMLNGWKYFLGLRPLDSGSTGSPRIAGGRYAFNVDPKVADVYWRIRHSPSLQAPFNSWATAEL